MSVAERKQQLFMRGMVNGNLQERDRLLYYTIGEFYLEMSLFVEEMEMRKEEMEKMRSK
jgi:hypothetical protein